MNPAIQGMNKNFKSLKNPAQIKKLLVNYTAVAAANAVLFHEISDEDDVKAHVLTDWIRGAYTMIPTLGIPLKIPKPYSTARLAMNLGENIVHAAYGYKTPNDVLFDSLRDVIVLFDPVGGGSSSIVNYFPTFASPLIQVAVNRNWLDDAIVKRQVAGIPAYLQPNYSTPAEYSKIAEIVYGASGGFLDFNPSIYEYLADAYLKPGSIGDVWDSVQYIMDKTTDKKTQKIMQSFVTGRIYDDLREDQKAYLYPFWDIYEKTNSRGLTQKELDYYFESGVVLMKMQKLSPELFSEGIMNMMRNYDWVNPTDITKAANRGAKKADIAIKKYGYKIDLEEVKEKAIQRAKGEIRLETPIIEKVGSDIPKINE
jgi:hypothetical protein